VSMLAEFREGVAYPIHNGPVYVGFVHIILFHFLVLPPIILENLAFH
jgi:hypothetical protein